MLTGVFYTGAALFVFMSLFYVCSQIVKKISIVDVAWGGGFILVAGLNLAMARTITTRQVLVTSMVFIWGVRLIAHLYSRLRGKPEDYRYQQMKERWGNRAAVRTYTHVFLFQGLLVLAIGYPLIMVNVHIEGSLYPSDFIGTAIWLVGFLCETVADAQLRRFIRFEKKSRDDIMTRGLWRYSRHPNYFGEALLWWGVAIVVLPVRYGWLAFFGPLILTILLLKVSGVPLLEKRYADNPAYRAYARKTSLFVPWFPKE